MEQRKTTHASQVIARSLASQMRSGGAVRFTVTLDALATAKLQYWAKETGNTRARLAAMLIEAALEDIHQGVELTDEDKKRFEADVESMRVELLFGDDKGDEQ